MAYSSEIAGVLTAQLDRLSKHNPHQLAGQLANLDFWLSEVEHCLAVIDGYRARFDRMKSVQSSYVEEHDTKVVYPDVAMSLTTPVKPRRIPDDELKTSRHELREAFYRFVIRGYREWPIDEAELRKVCDRIDLSIDLVDLRR